MVLTNSFLESVAKSMSSEAYSVTAYGNVCTSTDFEENVAATELVGEVGTRESLSVTRADNVVTQSFIRSSTSVVDTVNGDILTGVGNFTALTSGDLHSLVGVPSLLQTTGFDIEFESVITVSRR